MYAGGLSGTGSLIKTGPGDLGLSGSSSYNGPTSVAAGWLSVKGSLGSTAVTVANTAELGGSGSLGGSVLVQNGGRVAPGNSIESLAVGATTFEAGATFAHEVDSAAAIGVAADLLVVGGNLSIASGTLLEFTDLASQAATPFPVGTVFALVNYTGSWNEGLFTVGGEELANNGSFLFNDTEWRIRYDSPTGGVNFTGDYQDGSFVTITAGPSRRRSPCSPPPRRASPRSPAAARSRGFSNPRRARPRPPKPAAHTPPCSRRRPLPVLVPSAWYGANRSTSGPGLLSGAGAIRSSAGAIRSTTYGGS